MHKSMLRPFRVSRANVIANVFLRMLLCDEGFAGIIKEIALLHKKAVILFSYLMYNIIITLYFTYSIPPSSV